MATWKLEINADYDFLCPRIKLIIIYILHLGVEFASWIGSHRIPTALRFGSILQFMILPSSESMMLERSY